MLKKIFTWLLLSLPIFAALPLAAASIDLSREDIFVRKGFQYSWVTATPSPDDKNWHRIPPLKRGDRTIVLSELPLEGMPRRGFLALEKVKPWNFTFLTNFRVDERDRSSDSLKGVYFTNIGQNWSVYLNGKPLKSEIHLDESGNITKYRHMREVLIPIDPRDLKAGTNILAVRIIGDPTNIDSGFHRSAPFIIDDLSALEERRSEQASLILIFLYLFFGLYHLFIFSLRPAERYNFYYGAFSVLLFVYLVSRTHAVYSVIADSMILHRIEYCSLYALFPAFGAFADLLITGKYSRLTKILCLFYLMLIAVTALPVSNAFAIDVLRIWQVSAIIPLFYYSIIRIGGPVKEHFQKIFAQAGDLGCAARTLKALASSLRGTTAGNLLLGALIMAGCTVFDILDSMFWSYNYVLTTYGFFVFTMGITLILANRFIYIHKKLEATNEIIRNEMDLAEHIQKSLLPVTPADIDGWDIAVTYRPWYGPSGDFYDFYVKNSKLEGISIFDVSGHGISSALITMIIKPITFRAFNRMRELGLERIVMRINEDISREMNSPDTFLSCILLRFKDDAVEYVNAGHPNLLCKSHQKGEARIVDGGSKKFRGEPLGVNLSPAPPSVIKLTVKKGDILLLYTDCLIESKNSRNEQYGIDRLISSLSRSPDGTAEEILGHLVGDFFSFIDEKGIKDDFTVIVVRKA